MAARPPSTTSTSTTAPPVDLTLFPTGDRSLSRIALQSFCLGATFTFSLLSTLALLLLPATAGQSYWRLPAFFVFLSVFHFLEFHVTATYNAAAARADSFLLFNNGRAYTLAHTVAAAEIALTRVILPLLFPRLFASHDPAHPPSVWSPRTTLPILLGLVLVLAGQTARTVAMAQAGPSFSHLIARTRAPAHVLVTTGVYARSRHPSYAGFFWWALGTQLVCGNRVSLLGYAVVLWRFFRGRIVGEERFLVEFFGREYTAYKERTGTWLPFIR